MKTLRSFVGCFVLSVLFFSLSAVATASQFELQVIESQKICPSLKCKESAIQLSPRTIDPKKLTKAQIQYFYFAVRNQSTCHARRRSPACLRASSLVRPLRCALSGAEARHPPAPAKSICPHPTRRAAATRRLVVRPGLERAGRRRQGNDRQGRQYGSSA